MCSKPIAGSDDAASDHACISQLVFTADASFHDFLNLNAFKAVNSALIGASPRQHNINLPHKVPWSILTGDHKDPQYTYEQVLHIRIVIHDDRRLSYEREIPAFNTRKL